ncbi:MAG TPA: DUF4153 domain-containing protein [Clostridiaceae bacterium]|nr:DUF4153 domain-containing protein [Clostridiaceae bacterium]
MSRLSKFRNTLKGLTSAVTRFPLTSVFLLAAAIVNAMDIQSGNDDLAKYFLALITGAFLGVVAQMTYERFFDKRFSCVALNAVAAILTLGYYLIISPVSELGTEITVRTMVAIFALFIAFIWIPSIKSRTTFNESFMVAFKAFFISIFFAGIIFAGTSLILDATNILLFEVESKAYTHTMNIVFVLFAPVYFLSLIPVYFGKSDDAASDEALESKEDNISKMSNCPKYLEILISYIIIPLTAVFTAILAIYIVLNVGRDFWTDNLLEPMLVSYSITVILVYILASRLENKFAQFFRKIFPKVLIPIVVFQTIASVMKIGDTGIIHSRYYVILFGIFATIAGILFSFMPIRRNGIVACILIILSLISIVPPVDAFTVSRSNQIAILRKTLERNNMLEGNTIKPGPGIPKEEKERIADTLGYLNRMEYIDRIPFIPDDFNYYSDFEKIFGFDPYGMDTETPKFIYLRLAENTIISIADYDSMTSASINILRNREDEEIIGTIAKSGKNYTLKKRYTANDNIMVLTGEDGKDVIGFSAKRIFDAFEEGQYDVKDMITLEEATFTEENENAAMTVVVQTLNMEKSSSVGYFDANVYILVKIK